MSQISTQNSYMISEFEQKYFLEVFLPVSNLDPLSDH